MAVTWKVTVVERLDIKENSTFGNQKVAITWKITVVERLDI